MEHENRHFEEMTPEDQQLSELLDVALKVVAPEGLSERIANASLDSLNDKLNDQLEVACAIPERTGLADRCFKASVSSLQVENEPIAVITPIEEKSRWYQVALAACLVFAALVAIRLGTQSQPTTFDNKTVASNEVLSVEEEGLLLEDLNLSEYTYLADTRELAFADVTESFNSLRDDIELWQHGLFTE